MIGPEPPCPVCRAGQTTFFLNVDCHDNCRDGRRDDCRNDSRNDSRDNSRNHSRDYWRCRLCEATFLSPDQRPDTAAEKAEYDLHSNAVEDEGYRNFLARLADPLIERLASNCEGLDYGCGPGPALAQLLTEAGHRVTIWDPIYAPDRSVFSRTYDFVTCTEVVEHMHRPADEFERIDALLRRGGIFGVMTTFQTDDARFADWHYRRDPTHVVFYREHTMSFIADRMGWSMDIPRANVAIFRKPQPINS